MLRRKEFEKELNQIFNKICDDSDFKTKLNNIDTYIVTKHNISCIEYINGAKELSKASVAELYWLYESVRNQMGDEINRNFDFSSCFSNAEVTSYSKQKAVKEEAQVYPLRFSAMQIADDQWVGTISNHQLYDMYLGQAIRYNLNTQRPAKYTTRNGVREYRISLNKKSVQEIRKQLQDHTFIPNDISLNINADNPDVMWDWDGKEIIVEQGVMDIIDGYHRFKAIIEETTENPNFEVKFVLNIMNFSTEKACNYIAQQDKRNKIDKKYAKSLDITNPRYYMVNRLNEDVTSPLYGMIKKDDKTLIDYTRFFTFVDKNFEDTVKDRIVAQRAYKALKQAFTAVVDADLVQWSKEKLPTYRELYLCTYIGSKGFENGSSMQEIALQTIEAMKNIEQVPSTKIDNGQFTKQSEQRLLAYYERFLQKQD